jgi:anaerobic selenocysteine-containing dehydrogenase
MFGTEFSIAIPDIDHTDYFLLLGANPLVSNGSLMTAPDIPGRLRALRRRGGRLVVIDPRHTRTGDLADEHVTIRPGTDALLLAALAHELLAKGLASPGDHVRPWLAGLDVLPAALAMFTPETVEAATSIPAETTRRIARELATAPTAAVYGRMGTTTTAFGTVASWLIDVINVLTGNLDRPGGVLFPLPPAGGPNTHGEAGRGRGVRVPGSRRTRVRHIAGVFGELPAATIAEEIDTPSENGERLRALVTVAGNPVLSTPNGARLDAALKSLDFMVSIDPYLNETTRHAHVILPPPSPLTRSHFDILYSYFAIRNVASWSPPTFALAQGTPSEADLILRLAGIVMGGLDADTVDELVVADVASRLSNDASSRVMGRDPAELIAAASRRREDRILDLFLRAGPYGDGFGSYPGGLSIDVLEAAPHGIDLGPLRPRLPEVLRTPSGRVELAPPQLLEQLPSLEALLGQRADGLVLIGRRQLRSNNSWMHNLPLLAGGSNACTLQVHPQDAATHALMDGGLAVVRSRVGELTTIVEVTDRVAPGVVSLPHGWGHDARGTRLKVASQRPGVNVNLLTDETPLDPLSGNAVLNGIPVTVTPAHAGCARAEATRNTVAGQSASPAGKQVASRTEASAGSLGTRPT